MYKTGCVQTQLYLQDHEEPVCLEGSGLLTARSDQGKNESKQTPEHPEVLSFVVKIKTKQGSFEAEATIRVPEEIGPQHRLG